MAFDTLDTTPYFSSLMTISGGGLTVVGISALLTGANQGLAMPFQGKSAGKWYIESTAVVAGGADAFGVVTSPAICLAGGNGFGFIGGTGGSGSALQFGIGYKQDGDINYNRLYLIGQSPIAHWGAWTTGAVIGFALNLTGGWFAWTFDGVTWYGTTNTANPVTGVGCVKLSDYPLVGNGQYWPAVSFSNGAQYTFNFGQNAFTWSVPSGFTGGWTNTGVSLLGSWLSNGIGGAIGPPALCVSPYVCRASGVIAGLQGNCSSTTKGVAIVYDSDGAGGGPGTLLAQSAVVVGSAGLSSYNLLSPLAVTSGHTYYLGVFITPNGPFSYVTKSGGTTNDLWIDSTAVFPTPNASFALSSHTTDHLPMVSLPLTGTSGSGGGFTQGHIF